ncbi:MAG: hypothetical protein PHN44_00705 [Candidatus Marinimicrobia bacterium]|nr:hypothetical protein [Candidatus Neomarinimicrobiota bacterium]MDD5539114.1 hypothetical protein [Candidatus Neomarinimicrobiota bacterium]
MAIKTLGLIPWYIRQGIVVTPNLTAESLQTVQPSYAGPIDLSDNFTNKTVLIVAQIAGGGVWPPAVIPPPLEIWVDIGRLILDSTNLTFYPISASSRLLAGAQFLPDTPAVVLSYIANANYYAATISWQTVSPYARVGIRLSAALAGVATWSVSVSFGGN